MANSLGFFQQSCSRQKISNSSSASSSSFLSSQMRPLISASANIFSNEVSTRKEASQSFFTESGFSISQTGNPWYRTKDAICSRIWNGAGQSRYKIVRTVYSPFLACPLADTRPSPSSTEVERFSTSCNKADVQISSFSKVERE